MFRLRSLFSSSLWIAACMILLGVHHASAQPTMSVTRVASGYSRPVFATTSPGDPNRMFIIEQSTGEIEIVNPVTGSKNPNPFLVVAGLSTGGERGLLRP